MGRSVSAALLACLAAASIAHADEPSVAPWAVGLTPEREAAAKVALDEGNRLFLDKDYLGALAKYREAITHWDHPAIRFNVVRCLLQLDRPLEARENLELALAHGAAPLDPVVYNEALTYQKLLAKQIGEIVLECKQPGVALALDGKALGRACPLTETRRVEPGQHQVVATKAGFVTETVDLFVTGGKSERASIELEPLRTSTARVEQRWAPWIPWTVFGAGFVVTGIGGLVQLKSASDMDAFDAQGSRCPATGCTRDDLNYDLQAAAELENKIAITLVSVGAATAVVGGVMLYLNRARLVETKLQPSVTPVAGGAVATVGGHF